MATKAQLLKNPALILLENARMRSKRKKLPFALKIKDLIIPVKCKILGITLVRNMRGTNINTSPTLDRINNAKGYTKDNIQIISGLANQMKSSANEDQLMLFASWVFKNYTSLLKRHLKLDQELAAVLRSLLLQVPNAGQSKTARF